MKPISLTLRNDSDETKMIYRTICGVLTEDGEFHELPPVLTPIKLPTDDEYPQGGSP